MVILHIQLEPNILLLPLSPSLVFPAVEFVGGRTNNQSGGTGDASHSDENQGEKNVPRNSPFPAAESWIPPIPSQAQIKVSGKK